MSTASPNKTVKKHVAHVHMSGNLTLLERKIVNIMLLNAYDELLTKQIHTMPVSVLLELLGWGENGGLENLKAALQNILNCVFSFDRLNRNGKKKAWMGSNLLAAARIEDGVCSYQYPQFLAEELANPEQYATINISLQNNFTSGYALTLWENCLRFKNVGSTGWISVDTWRQLLGANAATYDQFKHLTSMVLKPGVKEVNATSDIEIAPEYRRELRKVIDVRFTVREKVQRALFDGQAIEDSIRQSPIFAALLALGIGEKMALVWMVQDPTRAAQVVSKYKTMAQQHPIGNPPGYVRRMFENGGVIGAVKAGPDRAAQQQAAAAAAAREREADQKREATKALLAGLPEPRRRALAAEYVAGAGAGRCASYNPETGKFRSAPERVQFTDWLLTERRAALAP
jgi:hypothetical protein